MLENLGKLKNLQRITASPGKLDSKIEKSGSTKTATLTKVSNLPIIAAFVALFAIGLDNYILMAILPQLAPDLHQTEQTLGYLASAYALPLALLAPLFGPLSDRIGRRKAMLLGMILFITGNVASGFSPGFEMLLVARIITGLGAAIFVPASYAYVGDRATPETRASSMSTLLTAMPASALVGLPAGGFIAVSLGWREVFGFITVVSLIGLALLWILPNDPPRSEKGFGYLEGLKRVAKHPHALKVISVTLIWATGAMGAFTYIGEFLHNKYDFTSDQIGLVLIVIGVVGVIATRSGAKLSKIVKPRKAVLTGISLFGTAILFLPWTNLVPLTIVVLGIWVFGTWFGLPAIQTIVSGLMPEARGTVLSFNTSAQYLGGVIGSPLAGLFLTTWGFPVMGLCSAFLAATAFTLALRVLPRE